MTDELSPASPLPGFEILLIEDSASDAYMASEMLAASDLADYKILHVPRLDEAKSVLETREFNLILLDLNLPDGKGIGNIEVIKSIVADVPIVVLSGVDDHAIALQAISAGAQDFLVKGKAGEWELERAIHYALKRRQLMIEADQLSTLDPLTGLANRRHFLSRLELALKSARRTGNLVVVVCFDVDDFKRIAHYSKEIGDAVLTSIGDRLARSVRDGDTVARFHGDEFGVLLEGRSGSDQISLTLAKIHDAMEPEFSNEGHDFSVRLSGGVAVYPQAGKDVHGLVRSAVSAMRLAKVQGRDRLVFAK